MYGYVYILQSEVNKRYYIGSTNNLRRRINDHNLGKSTYTKLTRPFKLVFSQKYDNISEARRIEYKLKKFKSKKILEKIVEDQIIKIGDD
ncbi:hypothetical protein A2630_03125 [Candidatus Woesebacteria bacterium RIFCSPHIGHO2_01_FULL_44_10]|uniref:GIY-YIG domain-containing protein n=1 Tax=Candidatus Woesebacteria bacterium RIFCSPLOWO2_01_FULL_44_14 TaxID=1802525 RepID=A0A1F8BZS9_9BACT|nr:MAG: hypothetical protein A2630_03125 [Candidatus Woesebacteria bacterium RIFCSPHIGHO2_01_FULL_44_10]OGM68808.1 MAG: hypothetical protein A2975_00340 [Candidatus Woesebacteria bacterium RIFCSPLOWO2_01_FULL_44_14]